jgi:hypothetical protein
MSTPRRSCFKTWIIYRPVHVPVDSFITDKRVSCCFNILQLFAAATGFIYTVYRSRLAAPFTISSNMWMNPVEKLTKFGAAAENQFPSYCQNKEFDFRYDEDWDYSNITCRALPMSKMFFKSLTEGSYFVSTMIQRFRSNLCSDHAQASSPSQICYPGVLTTDTSFLLGIDEAMLDATVSLTIPHLGVVGGQTLPTEIQLPNGTLYSLKGTASGGHRFTIAQWVELFGIDGGLNSASSGGNIERSIGQSRHRHVGMSVEIRVSIHNTNQFFEVPSTSIDRLRVRWTVSTKQVYTRIVMQDTRLPEHSSLSESSDMYGIRIAWVASPSETYVFSMFNFMMGMIDCVVIFSVSNLVASQAALYMCGSQSAKWREALRTPIDHLVVSREGAREEHGRRLSSLASGSKKEDVTRAGSTTVTPMVHVGNAQERGKSAWS